MERQDIKIHVYYEFMMKKTVQTVTLNERNKKQLQDEYSSIRNKQQNYDYIRYHHRWVKLAERYTEAPSFLQLLSNYLKVRIISFKKAETIVHKEAT